MEFDRIYAEVDLGRIEENMKAMKEHLCPGTKMYGVVKTDAYGHGAVPVARTIDRFVCGYAVATLYQLSQGSEHICCVFRTFNIISWINMFVNEKNKKI